jgi:hypothetical protein
MASGAKDVERERERKYAKIRQKEREAAAVDLAQDQWREGKSTRARAKASRLNPYGDASKAAEQDRINESIRTRQAQADAEAAAAASAPAGTVSDDMRARGAQELQAGLDLYGMADAKRAVKVRNRDYESNLAYTETMAPAGQAVSRRGLFSPGALQLPAPQPQQPPVQVVVQAPGAPPPAPPGSAAPLAAPPPGVAALPPEPAAGVPVPAGAVGTVPGQLPQALPDVPIPLEEEDEAVPIVVPAAEGPGVPEGAMPRGGPGGLLQQQLDAQEMQANAVVGEQTEAALALRDAADQAKASMDEAAAAKAEADARLEHELEASREANKVVADLTTKAREMGPIDQGRAFRNMGIGKRLLFGIQIALSSFGGRSQAEAHAGINRAIEDDLEDQRNELAKVGSDIDAARAVAGDRSNLLQQARSVIGDEQVAQDVVRVARLEQVKAELEARMAAAGIQRVGSEQEVLLNGLEQEIAAKNLTISQAAARNPEYFTKSVNVYGKNARAGMLLAGKKLVEQGVGASELADKQSGELEVDAAKGKIDELMQRQKLAAKQGDRVAEQAWKFAEKTERLQSLEKRIAALIDTEDDIPGYGYTEGVDSVGKLDTDQAIDLIIEDYGRIQSQGAINDEERKAFKEQVYKGVKFGDGRLLEGSEERLRKNLEGIRTGARLRMEGLQRALPPETSSFYDRVATPAQFDARYAGSTSADVVEED